MFLNKIDRYILRNMTRYAFFYTIVPTLILWIVQSRKIFELALGSSTSLLLILKLSLYLLPNIVPHIIPFAFLLATITLLVKLYNDSELVIMWGAGASPVRLMRGFMVLAFLGVILVMINNFYFAPQISRQLKIELNNVKNDLIKGVLKPGVIQSPRKGVILYIDQIRNHSYIEGFYLQHRTKKDTIQIFTAKEAVLFTDTKKSELLLLKGSLLNKPIIQHHKRQTDININEDTDTHSAPTILEFEKFSLNISDFLGDLNDQNNVHFKARDYKIHDLLSAKYAKNDRDIIRFKAKGHEQIITSFFPFIFVVIALFMMLKPFAPRGFPYILILKTVFWAVLFRIISSVIQNQAAENLDYILVAYGFPLIMMLGLLSMMIHNRRGRLLCA